MACRNPNNAFTNPRRVTLVLSAIAASAAMLVGCGSSEETVEVRTTADVLREVRDDPTPALKTLGRRESDISNENTLMLDTNRRMLWQDLRRITYLNRPSRLAREPISQR